jgi:hypothetical protein
VIYTECRPISPPSPPPGDNFDANSDRREYRGNFRLLDLTQPNENRHRGEIVLFPTSPSQTLPIQNSIVPWWTTAFWEDTQTVAGFDDRW